MTEKNKKNVPPAPTKLSAAIEMALADLVLVEADPNYKINMCVFHDPCGGTGPCLVCLAGSVMAKTLKSRWDLRVLTKDFGCEWRKVFVALDWIRCGEVYQALQEMGQVRRDTAAYRVSPGWVDYLDQPEKFKLWLECVVEGLKKKGL